MSCTNDITFVKVVKNTNTAIEKQQKLCYTKQKEFDIAASLTDWLDCTIIQEAHILLATVNPRISGFQRPTLGSVRQFDVITTDYPACPHN